MRSAPRTPRNPEIGNLDLLVELALSKAASSSSTTSNTIRIPIALVTVASTTIIPAGAIILSARLDVSTPYSPGATISIGQAGSVAEFMATLDNNPGVAGLYDNEQDTSAASTNPMLVTVGGAPAAGAGFALVTYVAAPSI